MTLQITMNPSEPVGQDYRPSVDSIDVAAQAFGRIPPTALMLLSILSVQLGSALATVLFSSLGAAGAAWLSIGFSAVLLTVLRRPKIGLGTGKHAGLILWMGLTLAGMELPFFLALQYIPLGIAATITFVGPLGVAVAMSRRPAHFLWIGIAVLGVGLLAPDIGGDLDPRGLAFAALSAIAWASFAPISKRVGDTFGDARGLVLGMWAAALMLLPIALAEGMVLHANALELSGALVVALLTSALPLSMEFQALQRMSARSYGVLLTLEPAIAALVGGIFLGQALGTRMLIAVFCVTIAALGITLTEKHDGQ